MCSIGTAGDPDAKSSVAATTALSMEFLHTVVATWRLPSPRPAPRVPTGSQDRSCPRSLTCSNSEERQSLPAESDVVLGQVLTVRSVHDGAEAPDGASKAEEVVVRPCRPSARICRRHRCRDVLWTTQSPSDRRGLPLLGCMPTIPSPNCRSFVPGSRNAIDAGTLLLPPPAT